MPPPLPPGQVVEALEARSRRFVSLVDTGISLRIEIRTRRGWEAQPALGGWLAFDSLRPGLWLRAEKLGQKIFSLRAGLHHFWLEIPDTREVVTGSEEAYAGLPWLIHPSEVLFWFGSPRWLGLTLSGTRMRLQPEHYRFEVLADELLLRVVLVDRRRLVISEIVEYDLLGRVTTRVRMDRHRETDGFEFPRRLTVERVAEGYRIRLRLGRPRFNKSIQGAAFTPKARPGWRHIDLDREPLSSVEAFGGQR
jgi:hypothetical protein